MFELDAVYDHKMRGGVHQVNLGIRTEGVANSTATGVNSDLAQAVFEAVSKAVSSPLLSRGFTEIPDPAKVEYRSESLSIAFGSIEEEVEAYTPEELARAYLRFVQDFVVRVRGSHVSRKA